MGRRLGGDVDHAERVTKVIRSHPGPPIVASVTDSIMSYGNVVRSEHYVAFLDKLGKMTNTEGEWDVRPVPPLQAPPPGGPFRAELVV